MEPELPICDAHHHLWVRGRASYLLEDLRQDLSAGHNVVSTVAIECGYGYREGGSDALKPVGETEFLEGVAERAARDAALRCRAVSAIVGFADLSLGDEVAPVLEAHLAVSPGRFRGIRYATTWDASDALRSDAAPGVMASREFRAGFARLQTYGLSFDAWLYHPQLRELAGLARSFPEVSIILDHIGAPLGVGPYGGKRDEVFRDWSEGMATLAECPNVFVKLGGMGSVRSGYDWHRRVVRPSSEELAAALKPYFEFCIEKYGADRCMFESNFPVEKSSNSYVALWNACKRITQRYSAAERAALFHDTAARVYRIEE